MAAGKKGENTNNYRLTKRDLNIYRYEAGDNDCSTHIITEGCSTLPTDIKIITDTNTPTHKNYYFLFIMYSQMREGMSRGKQKFTMQC